jgi:hypothetical protein
VIETEGSADYAVFDEEPPVEAEELVVIASPCPGRQIRGGIGGQAFTACSFCGEMMPSTAGPHSRDGLMLTPARVVAVSLTKQGRWVVEWRRFYIRDGVAL